MERLNPADSITQAIGVVGLGIMGGAMAGNLLADGLTVFGHDVSDEAVSAFAAAGGTPVATPAAAARAASIVIMSLPTGAALATVVAGTGGLSEAATPDNVVIETSTLALADKEFARVRLAATGTTMLDCPISGTGAQAPSRDLVFLASGDSAAISRVRPVLARLGRTVHEVGPFGAGSRLKFVANLLVGIHNVATAEAFVLAEKAGLDMELVYDILADSAATSRILQLRMPMMIADRYAPPTARLATFVKDLDLISGFAGELGAPTALLEVVLRLYASALAAGMGDLDSAAVCAVIEELAGVDRRPSLLDTRGGDTPHEVALEQEVEDGQRD
jgi:putative dehydrogenase